MANYKRGSMAGSNEKLEKYYTDNYLMEYMDKEILQKYYKGEISEFLETSAGSGNMIDYLKSKYNVPVLAYDIKNETGRSDIIETDYLKTKLPYKIGRVCFMNPPFQKGLKFVYKSLEESDYCVSVLSINSFMNIDYDNYNVDSIDIFRNYDFGGCVVSICIIGISKK